MKSYCGGPIGTPTLFRTVSFPTPYGIPFPKIVGSQPQPKAAIAIILGTGKATDCKFARYIQRVQPNKSPWKFWRKGSVGVSRDCPIFWVLPIISGMGKATNFKFCRHIHRFDQNNSPLKISGAVAGCVVRTLKTFKCTHILGASRGLLCDSYAVLFFMGFCSDRTYECADKIWSS